MATFLELVNDVERESGTIGQSQRLSTVTGAVGRQEKIVEWTAEAWRMIQRSRPDWTFRRTEFSAPLTAGNKRYTSTELGAWERGADGFENFSIYDPTIGQSDETYLQFKDFRTWRDLYDFGSHDANRPCIVTIDNQRNLCVGPTPDRDYTLRGIYRRSIQSLTADDDEPYIGADHHQVIVWLALTLLAEHDEAPVPIGMAMNRYREALGQLVLEYTEPVQV